MKPNIGFIDSLIRVALSMIVIGCGISFEAWWGFLGFIPLVTFFFKWSLLYYIFNINTNEHHGKLSKNSALE
jgi:hypothetical protein